MLVELDWFITVSVQKAFIDCLGAVGNTKRDPTSSWWQCRKAADTFLKRGKIREERRAQETGRFLWAEEVGEYVTEMRFELSLEFLLCVCVCARTHARAHVGMRMLAKGSLCLTTFCCHSPSHDRTRPGRPTLELFWKMLTAAALAPEKVSIALTTEITQVQGTKQVVTWSLLG